MKRKISLMLTLLLLILTAVTVFAQTGGGYDLTWNTIDGGGGSSIGGAYALIGTIGQADAGTLSGGGYTLNGGFWSDVGSQFKVFLPLILR